MVTPASKRKEKYRIKSTETMPKAYESMIKRADIDIYDMMEAIDRAVNEILTKHGVTGGKRVDYQRFAKKLFKFWRNNTLTNKILAGLVAEYARGYDCNPNILREISKTVLDILGGGK